MIHRTYSKQRKKWTVKEKVARFKGEEGVGWFIVDTRNLLERDHKIIFLNADYDQAIVVGPTMRTIRIAFRDPNLTERELDHLLHRAGELGFKVKSLVRVDHYEDWQGEADTSPIDS